MLVRLQPDTCLSDRSAHRLHPNFAKCFPSVTWRLVICAWLVAAVSQIAVASEEFEDIEGFEVGIDHSSWNSQDAQKTADLLLLKVYLGKQIRHAGGLLPQQAFKALQRTTKIDVNDHRSVEGSGRCNNDNGYEIFYCPKSNTIHIKGLKYGKNVLQDELRGGEWIDGKEVWGNPHMILHEFAHAWHDQYVPQGYDNKTIRNLYRDALDEWGDSGEYYWESNAKEYFAEFTVMYYAWHWEVPGSKDDMGTSMADSIKEFWELPPRLNPTKVEETVIGEVIKEQLDKETDQLTREVTNGESIEEELDREAEREWEEISKGELIEEELDKKVERELGEVSNGWLDELKSLVPKR